MLNRYHHALILSEFLRQHSPNIVVIGGAGFSTESGQPDYRSPFGAYSKGHKPITCQEFLSSETVSFFPILFSSLIFFLYISTGFLSAKILASKFHGVFSDVELEPKCCSFCGCLLGNRELYFFPFFPFIFETYFESLKKELISHIITQNVDRLHSKAGSQKILELHGNLFEVGCVSCNFSTPRPEFQERVLELNPSLGSSYSDPTAQTIRPDGDVAVLPMKVEDFEIPPCLKCGGILKPKVVFFGESIPRKIVDESYSLIDRASALICIGTSLQVHSAFRLVKRAKERNLPIAGIFFF